MTKLILWDWNGTLLDDVDASIAALNVLLGRRGMPLVDRGGYRRVFMFPVIEYYKKLGFTFDNDDFGVVAREFVAEYAISSKSSALFSNAAGVLDTLKAKGFRQSIVSAMPQSALIGQIGANNVAHYFQDIVGLRDIYAASKIDSALNYIKSRRIDAKEVLFIGDTNHDYEVARSIGCKCMLISSGHQDLAAGAMPDATILGNIGEVCKYLP
jgi:phosphoglycolate phosphatase